MKIFPCLLTCLLFIQCNSAPPLKKSLSSAMEFRKLNIPDYFNALQKHYSTELFQLDSTDYLEFCNTNHLLINDSTNRKQWIQIHFLHRLLTSSTAQNGALGPVLKIPYFWHWIDPNPRHHIRDLKTGSVLTKTPTIPEFKNYKSYADIDRPPSLFFKELFSPDALYTHSACDSFSTFGWCSEREAAFSCLMHLYHYESKVFVRGNHCWSIHLVYFKNQSGKPECFEVKTDNTFDIVTFEKINPPVLSQWYSQTGDPGLARWHNTKSHSSVEKTAIRKFIISQKAFMDIEIQLRNYLVAILNEQ